MSALKLTISAAMVLLLAACGGAAAPATNQPQVTTAPTAPSATAAPTALATSTPGTGGFSICSVLTPAELQSVLGVEYDAGTIDLGGQCVWNVPGVQSNNGTLIVGNLQDQDFRILKGMFSSGGSDQTVAGHAAFWNPSEGLGSLWVDVGGAQTFVLSFPRSGDLTAEDLAAALALAEIAVPRI